MKLMKKTITALLTGIVTIYVYLLYYLLFDYPLAVKQCPNFGNFKVIRENEVRESDLNVRNSNYQNCTFWDCLDIYKCGKYGRKQISIYVYPFEKYWINSTFRIESLSQEFDQMLKSVYHSKYYTDNPNEACLFMPSIDLLNGFQHDPKILSFVLRKLKFWNNGENHIIFNMVRNNEFLTSVNFGKALLLASGLDTFSYRPFFDIALPMYSPLILDDNFSEHNYSTRLWSIILTQSDIKNKDLIARLKQLSYTDKDLLIFHKCFNNSNNRCSNDLTKTYRYPNLIKLSHFCMILSGNREYTLYQTLIEALSNNCIPIIISDYAVLPFESVIDWKRIALFFSENDFEQHLFHVVTTLSPAYINHLHRHIYWIFQTYFRNISKITETIMDILQDRFFPFQAKNYMDWNSASIERQKFIESPLFFGKPLRYSNGFTAVILTYNRVKSLFKLISNISMSPSLSKILIIWNNQKESPPNKSLWPKIKKPLRIMETKENKLSNRFIPYDEIETEAIFSIDDDITMLTVDELEFGFQVWKENPDKIVGFPSRTHVYDNLTNSWKYESEWKNEISMILTGAAFIHKYLLHQYTSNLPMSLKNEIDRIMNCEDVAMNFLVANLTRKSVLKIGTRKKFKCSQCPSNKMLSESLTHMKQRTLCINDFSRQFRNFPIFNTEYRADPVLFKDTVTTQQKKFHNIGSL